MLDLKILDLNDYEDMVDLPEACLEMISFFKDQLDDLYCDEELQYIDYMFDEAEEKLKAFENVLAIQNHIEKYGVSQELLDITGYSSEGILGNIGSAIVTFFKWLWNWCKRICSFFYGIFFDQSESSSGGETSGGSSGSSGGRSVSVEKVKKIKKAMSSKSELKKLRNEPLPELKEIDIPENYEKMLEETKKSYIRIVNYNLTQTNVYSRENSEKKYDGTEITKSVQYVYNTYYKTITYKKTNNLKDAATFIFDLLEYMLNCAGSVEPAMKRFDAIAKLQFPKSTDDKSVDDFISKVCKELNIKFDDYELDKNNLIYEKDAKRRLQIVRKYINDCNAVIHSFLRISVRTRQIGFRMLTQLCSESKTGNTKTRGGIFIRVAPPKNLVESLRKIWKLPSFHIYQIIITNMKSEFFSKTSLGGYAKRSVSNSTVFINITSYYKEKSLAEVMLDKKEYEEYKNQMEKLDAKDMYNFEENQVKEFMRTIIHECRHLLQYQTNDPHLAEPTPSNIEQMLNPKKHVEYLNKNVEREARRAAQEYVQKYMTDEDMKWLQGIIKRAIEQEARNVRKYRPDIKK